MDDALVRNGEYACVSMDCTLKCTFGLLGQVPQHKPWCRGDAAYEEEDSLHRVLTVRGTTGAVLCIAPIPNDKSETIAPELTNRFTERARKEVLFVRADNPGHKMFADLKKTFENLEALALDPIHLAINYEYGTGRARTAGSRALRKVLSTISAYNPMWRASRWGPMYSGGPAPRLDAEESRLRNNIYDRDMTPAKANAILDAIDPNKPIPSRVAFIESLAAISVVHSAEMGNPIKGFSNPRMIALFTPNSLSRSPRIIQQSDWSSPERVWRERAKK